MTTYPNRGAIGLLSPTNGPPDVLVVQYNSAFGLSYLQVLLNAAGAFRQGEIDGVDAGGGGLGFTVGDFNGDCIPDVATTTTPESGCGGAGGEITVVYGDGQGGFGPPQALPRVGSAPFLAAPLGPVTSPRALAVFDACGGGLTVYGDASRH
jgi:hypothetical protein